MVLGNAWLKGLGHVVHDYHSKTMEFKLNYKKRFWMAINAKDTKSYEAMTFEQLCLGGASCFAIVVANDERGRESLEGA